MIEHLVNRGNPRLYSNWLDESLNKTLRAACRQLSQATFEPELLVHMERLLEENPRQFKRRRASEASGLREGEAG